jgi:hypothetical protein
VFARGSGIECRKYVQELNLLKKTAADIDFLNSQTQCLPEYSDDANQDVTSCEIATQKVIHRDFIGFIVNRCRYSGVDQRLCAIGPI